MEDSDETTQLCITNPKEKIKDQTGAVFRRDEKDCPMEEAVYDRLSFQKFLDTDLMNDRIPDETTILNFRRLLEDCELTHKIFKLINSGIFSQKASF